MKFLMFILLSFAVLSSRAQVDNSNRLIGKWQVCYSLDNYDTACVKPFNFYILKQGGIYQGRDFVCGNATTSMKGSWTLDGTKLVITALGNECGANYDQIYSNLTFVTKDFFYSKVLGTYENLGHIVFYSFKRIE
ncbi:MAG: hypothetical protein EOP48_14330 [Sphingobacteriales bacterium]|nr:MAG: hypothetical protein EOP48_14330 [Sphingobacteriales bacterium]